MLFWGIKYRILYVTYLYEFIGFICDLVVI